MNKAQQRTWYRLAVSAAGLAVMSGVLAIIEINALEITDVKSHTALRGLGLLCTIPLILIVVLDRGWKRIYDERDMYIERQSLIVGGIAAFVFLSGAALTLLAANPRGSIDVFHLASLIYLAYFAWLSASSIMALIQYGREGKGEQV